MAYSLSQSTQSCHSYLVFFSQCVSFQLPIFGFPLNSESFCGCKGMLSTNREEISNLLYYVGFAPFLFFHCDRTLFFRLTCTKLCTCTPKTSQWLSCSACYLKIAAKFTCFQLLQYFRKLLLLLIFSHNLVPSWGKVQLKIIACFVFFFVSNDNFLEMSLVMHAFKVQIQFSIAMQFCLKP